MFEFDPVFSSIIGLVATFGFLGFFGLILAIKYRRVVPTNEVHIVQSAKATTSFGKETNNGNSYYEWPSWIPKFGVTKVVLPVSNFDIDLHGYEAYDEGRLPFVVDVKAFFHISETNKAAQRVASFQELNTQLEDIVRGAVRTILASNKIEEIMQGRSKFGEEFTREVTEQLGNWGVSTVKNIELMDIRDTKDSHVIRNIMEKKKSFIEMESRTEVAKNRKSAETAEIQAQQDIDLRKQEAQQQVGLRTVEAKQQVDLANQTAIQRVKEQEKTTKEKEMAVQEVAIVRQAEITKKSAVVQAEQNKETTVINAEAKRDMVVIDATAQLEATKKSAEGITLTGKAKADAEKEMQLAPVYAQTTLAKEIGSNENYQKYLVTIEQVKANIQVGVAQAKALERADVKVITNAGSPTEGLKSVMDLFSSKGGTEVGSMVEAFANTPTGEEFLKKLGFKSAKTTTKELN